MQSCDMYPPGRVLWAMRDSDLHPSHRSSSLLDSQYADQVKGKGKERERVEGDKDKLRLFEVTDVEKVFGGIVFAKDMLT
jgi:sn1-specific diacylglycerol lipase